MNKSRHKNYSRADLIRYASGQMTDKEMHELESASLNDPFLHDALEGYAEVTTEDADLDLINAAIKKKSATKGGSSGVFKMFRLLSVAATLLIISFSAYFLLKKETPATPNSPVLAKNETPSQKPTLSENTATGTDQVEIVQSTQAQKKAELKQQQQTSWSSASGLAMERPVMTESAIASDDVSDKAAHKIESKFKTDSAVYAVAETKQLTAEQDASQIRKEVATGNVSIGATEPASAAVELNEVVVTSAMNARKKNPEGRSASVQKVKAEDINIAGSGTYSNFNDLTENNRKTIQDSAGNTIHGEVILGFRVDNSGRPKNIRVLKSLQKACDEEAIRLLREGPDWPTGSGKRKQVITF